MRMLKVSMVLVAAGLFSTVPVFAQHKSGQKQPRRRTATARRRLDRPVGLRSTKLKPLNIHKKVLTAW